MILRTFEDGSELTLKTLVIAFTVGASCAVGVSMLETRYINWKLKQTMKKYGWPEESWK